MYLLKDDDDILFSLTSTPYQIYFVNHVDYKPLRIIKDELHPIIKCYLSENSLYFYNQESVESNTHKNKQFLLICSMFLSKEMTADITLTINMNIKTELTKTIKLSNYVNYQLCLAHFKIVKNDVGFYINFDFLTIEHHTL